MLKSENNRIVIEEPNGCINYGNIGPRPFRFVRFVYLDLHLYNRGEANQSQMSYHVRGGGAWRSLTARRRWRGALPGSSRRRGGGAEEAVSGGALRSRLRGRQLRHLPQRARLAPAAVRRSGRRPRGGWLPPPPPSEIRRTGAEQTAVPNLPREPRPTVTESAGGGDHGSVICGSSTDGGGRRR